MAKSSSGHLGTTMKVSAVWILCFALMVFCISFVTSSSLSVSDAVFIDKLARMKLASTSRKLKENSYNNRNIERKNNARDVNVEDYNPIDPVPSSKASIRPGPIEHGTPLNPFIPKRSPPPSPAHPKKYEQVP